MPQIGGEIAGTYELAGGLISGCIIACGLLAWTIPGIFWLLASPLVIIFGILLLLDDALPYGRQPHLGSEASGFVAGVVIAILSFYAGLLAWVLFLMLLAGVIKLGIRFLKGSRQKTYKTKAH
jgi:hypothetical protein